MKRNDLNVRVGGQAGDGSYTTGELLAKVLKSCGLWVVTLRDFPSRIRGGHTNYTVRAKDEPIFGPADAVDLLIAFDQDSIDIHLPQIAAGGAVIYDSSEKIVVPDDHRRRDDVHYFGLPMGQMARDELGAVIMRNTIALGVVAGVLALDDEPFRGVITKTYGGRGAAEANTKAYLMGKKRSGELRRVCGHYQVDPRDDAGRLMLLGNEAIAYGALVAGCRMLAAYPITPATEIMEWMVEHLPEHGGAVLQAEDEISALCMAVGANYAGVRAMTSTSGPGFALMTEALSMAGMNETPVVIVDAQRAGPSTGLPTKTEQGDLNQAIFSGHGDFPRIVISPGNVEESFYLTVEAFNLAEKYQCPVILLTEQTVAQTKQTIPRFDLSRVKIERGKLLGQEELDGLDGYRRYAWSDDGVSPRSIPGMAGGLFIGNSNEHGEDSYIDETPENRVTIMRKRMQKLATAAADMPPPRLHGDPEAEIGFIGYGGVYGPVLEAMASLGERGVRTKFLQLVGLWPFPEHEVRRFLDSVDKAFVVENNYGAQLRGLVQRYVGPLPKLESVLRFDGYPFRPVDIVREVEQKMEVLV